MTTINEAKTTLAKAFKDSWDGRTVLTFPNEDFKPPVNVAWTRLSFQHLPNEQQETLGPPGARRYKRDGIVFVEIHVPSNTGTELIDGHVQKARDILEGSSFSDIDTFDFFIRDESNDKDWYRVVLEGSFRYYEVK